MKKPTGPQSRAPLKWGGGAKNLMVQNLLICFANVRGLRKNFDFVESFLGKNRPDVLALCETNLDSTVSSSSLGVDGYLPLFRKDSCTHMHGLGVYVRDSLPSARAYDYESPSHSFMCFKLLLFGSAAYYLFIVYRSPASQDCSILNEISDQMDRVLLSHSPSLLELCFVSDSSGVESLSPLPPLGNSDHVLLELRLKCQSFHNQDSPFHRTSYDYNGADWDSFRAFI